MQNDIRLHLAKNEQQQSDIESTLAKQLQTRFEQNVRAFVRRKNSKAGLTKS
jgi:membrane carboxypeptidase/penicillin-binding protein PbpC